MYKIIEQNGQVAYNIVTYAVDSFNDLPKTASFGDKAIFNNNGSLGIALYLSDGWIVSTVQAGGDNIVLQADFIQNDPTAKDYIKNRPFYFDTNAVWEKEVVSLEQIPFVAKADTELITVQEGVHILPKTPFIPGEQYCITIGDFKETSIVKTLTLGTNIFNYFGNLNLLSVDLEDTGESFLVYTLNRDLIILVKNSILVPDNYFLKILWESDILDKSLVLIDNLKVTSDVSLLLPGFNLKLYDSIIFNIDNKEYKLSPQYIKDIIYVGNSLLMSSIENILDTVDTKEEFCLYNKVDGSANLKLIFAEQKEHTISLVLEKRNAVQKLNSIFMYDSEDCFSIGKNSHIEGARTIALGTASHAEGVNTKASGDHAHVEGYYSEAQGGNSHAEGAHTQALGMGSHSEGISTIAQNIATHAEGTNSIASGNVSHAEGHTTLASGENAHSEGTSTKAIGISSHAEGILTEAMGLGAHAEGVTTKAKADASHAEGLETIASGVHQHVEGRYNVEDTASKYAHIIGNGNPSVRSNAHTLDWNGNAWYAGNMDISGNLKVLGNLDVSGNFEFNPTDFTTSRCTATELFVKLTEGTQTLIIPKVYFSTDGTYTNYSETINNDWHHMLKQGARYRIIIDGEEFIQSAMLWDNDSDSEDKIYLGNLFLINDAAEDTGEDFCIYSGKFYPHVLQIKVRKNCTISLWATYFTGNILISDCIEDLVILTKNLDIALTEAEKTIIQLQQTHNAEIATLNSLIAKLTDRIEILETQ